MKDKYPISPQTAALTAILAIITATVMSFCSTGCKTVDPNRQIALARLASYDAAYIGCSLDLAARTNDLRRAAWQASEAALAGFANGTNLNLMALTEALQKLPVKQLHGNQGAVYITGIVQVYSLAAALWLPTTDTSPFVQAVAGGLDDGIKQALIESQPVGARAISKARYNGFVPPKPPKR